MTARSSIPASIVTPSRRRHDRATRVHDAVAGERIGRGGRRPPRSASSGAPAIATRRAGRPAANAEEVLARGRARTPRSSRRAARRRERVGRVLHRVGRDHVAVVAVDVRGLEVALEGDRRP